MSPSWASIHFLRNASSNGALRAGGSWVAIASTLAVLGQGMSSLDREWADAARTGDGGPDKVHTTTKQFKKYAEYVCSADALMAW
jgi:hypothetical protein